MENKDIKKKLTWYMRLVILFFVIIASRYVYLSLFLGPDIVANEILENRVRETTNRAERGTITDSNGNILAMSLLAQDIALNPNLIVRDSHKDKVAKLLSENIENLSYNEVMDVLNSDLKYKVIAKKVSPDITQIIRNSGLGGIQISQAPTRIYTNGALGATFLGFVNNNGDAGAGIEIKLDKYLAGTDGLTIAEVSPYGEILPIGTQTAISPTDGQNVQLTIDISLQNILEKHVKTAVDELQPEAIHAILMETSTGKVKAMVSYPTYDPNNYQETDSSTWTNTPANFTYEAGSIMKPILVAGALSVGAIEDNTTLPSGSQWVQGKLVRDWNGGRGFGILTAKTALFNSSNIAMMRIGDLLGKEKLIQIYEDAGIGKKTGIEIPGEESGYNFPTVEALRNDPIRTANVTFGQGIVTTPIQMVTAISEIANGGYNLTPTLVEKITDNNRNIIYQFEEPNKEDRIYSEEAAELTRSYMNYTYQNYSSDYHVEGYEGGAKTGTAWYAENGAYVDGEIIGSMVGFMPYENPEYTLLISVKAPQNVEYGSGAAGPTFQRIMTDAMHYANIVPTKGHTDEEIALFNEEEEFKELLSNVEVPVVNNLLFDTAKIKLLDSINLPKKFEVNVVQDGKGEVVTNQSYSFIDNTFTITLKTKPLVVKNKVYLPNLVGEKYSTIEQLFDNYKLDYTIYGSGVINTQNIDSGTYKKDSRFVFWGE